MNLGLLWDVKQAMCWPYFCKQLELEEKGHFDTFQPPTTMCPVVHHAKLPFATFFRPKI